MNSNINKILVDRDRLICDAENTFDDINKLRDILKSRYNEIENCKFAVYKKETADKYGVNYEYDSKTVKISLESFEEWVERKGEDYLLYEVFKDILVASENLPDYEEIKDKLTSSYWNFSKVLPKFKFSLFEHINYNYILSMNPCYTVKSDNYLGTLDEFKEKFGTIPYACIFIANSMNNKQHAELAGLLAKHTSFNDGQGFYGSYSDQNW